MKRKLHWYCEGLEEGHKPKAGILFLPGRGGHGVHMMQKYQNVFNWGAVAMMSLSPLPVEYGWYPMPNGPMDQRHSVEGLRHANNALNTVLDQIEEVYGLSRDKIILAGFSAGAVVALHNHTTTKKPCAGVVSHGGAILEPDRLKDAKHDKPIVLNHSRDDFCFDWFERYLPMKKALVKKGYKVWVAERSDGNHVLLYHDIDRCQKFYEKVLNIKIEPTRWNPHDDEDEFSMMSNAHHRKRKRK